MILMALDHTRDFFSGSGLNPRDVTEPALFLTRWITHFCAPVFVFLAGISAWLYWSRRGHTLKVSRFLRRRGLFLVILELTVVRVGWTFHFSPDFVLGQVIWVIGWSMIILSVLVYLPSSLVGLIGIMVIATHNLLDSIPAGSWGQMSWLWIILHEPGIFHPFPNTEFFALYSLIPWFGVMAAGYAFGPLMQLSPHQRQRRFTTIGLSLLIIFVILRFNNIYGDPQPWSVHNGFLTTLLSFIDCEKYPPSLLFLLMTLGPAIAVLPLLDRLKGLPAQVFLTFGRVPLLFYLIHIPLIHGLAVLAAYSSQVDVGWLFGGFPLEQKPDGYGFSLPAIYLIWFGIMVLLYPICLKFSHLKQNHPHSWLSYL
jgi:uncharacterized membrane protein